MTPDQLSTPHAEVVWNEGWNSPSDPPLLAADEIHIWAACLDEPPVPLANLHGFLSPDERTRADRLCHVRNRDRFVAGRGLLRAVLARYLAVDPCNVAFSCNPKGKPFLAFPPAEKTVHFNLAHSGPVLLLAVTRIGELGVDVERTQRMFDAQRIAARFFTKREQAELRVLPEDAVDEAFFRCWTGKEAYLKATGRGVADSLDRVEVSLKPGERARILTIDGNRARARRWSLLDLRPAPGYIGALAIEASHWRLQRWRLQSHCQACERILSVTSKN